MMLFLLFISSECHVFIDDEIHHLLKGSISVLSVSCSARVRFMNKPADGGVTALHMAALNGHFECVQLLLELGASALAVTFPYGTSANLIGTYLILTLVILCYILFVFYFFSVYWTYVIVFLLNL